MARGRIAASAGALLVAGAVGGLIGHFAFPKTHQVEVGRITPENIRPPISDTHKDQTLLISRADGLNGDPGLSDSTITSQAVSSDGRYVVFTSGSNNFSADDNDSVLNVYRRDIKLGKTELVSRAGGRTGAAANGNSRLAKISEDGRFVFFASEADNLSTADDNALPNLFRRDMNARTTLFVTRVDVRNLDPNGPPTMTGRYAISPNGRFVAFDSLQNGRVMGSRPVPDVFLRDIDAGTTTLVSRADGQNGAEPTRNGSQTGAETDGVSRTGRFVLFDSDASNLVAGDANLSNDLFRRDVTTGATEIVSVAPGGQIQNGAFGVSGNPALSADGDCAFFVTSATNLSSDDPTPEGDTYGRDVRHDVTTLVDRAAGDPGQKAQPGGGFLVDITPSGGRVAFRSVAQNLGGPVSGHMQLYVRNTFARKTTLVSRATGSTGDPVDQDVTGGAVSGNARYVAFETRATNLFADGSTGNPGRSGGQLPAVTGPQPTPTPPTKNVFVRDLTGPLPAAHVAPSAVPCNLSADH
jgi:TolB protein